MQDVYMTEPTEAELQAQHKAKEEAQANSRAEDDQTSENVQEDNSKDTKEESAQFEAELQREREAREKAEKAASDLAFKLREKKRNKVEDEETEEDLDEDKPMTRKEFLMALSKEREKDRKAFLETKVLEHAKNLASNDTEAQLIVEKWKNRSFPENVSLEEQIEECYLAANRKRILGENSELKRALAGKGRVSKDYSSTHQDSIQPGQPKLAPNEAQTMARIGYKWNGSKSRWEKKLSNGKILVKSNISSPTQVIG